MSQSLISIDREFGVSEKAPPQDLWSSILDSVSSTRSTPHRPGKSLLASTLLQKPVADDSTEESRTDFALGYDWADVKDGDEDTLARLSVYTVPSDAKAYSALLPHFLPPKNVLPHTAVMIVLDWTRPWTFVEELETWLKWVEQWAKGDGSREVEIVREENRERLQVHLQHYTEPSADTLPATSNLTSSAVLPLGPGTFTHNSAGVPIVVVCSKADLIDEGSNLIGPGTSGDGWDEWEERTDSIMQVLRTICLKYGAALFYTTPQPSTLQAPSPGVSAGMEAPASIRNPFVFHHKPNTLDRDRIVVPAGWDSWGKIGVLREGFEAKSWGEAWDTDIEASEGESEEASGAKRMYRSLIPDQGAKSATAGIVGPMGSSSFSLPNVERALSEMEARMGGSSALSASVNGDSARKLSRGTRPTSGLSVGAPGASTVGRTSTSPTLGTSTNATGGQTQHEVLQNFFQSLLSSKDRAGQSAAASRTAATQSPRTNGNASGPDDTS
ncbi:dynein light intermediate chain-domain-containing protein [Pisolithus orientalis]|uniref:dynein light intermediate chain-domain-containing protein n=1 Tax=Pisolithus orientalis TaxID=936130 RepID=UPI002224F4D3|nr:dynein light intermediate chain-domain-containing protein [Pisolithus orientalis]KAI6034907.1 dynein light intermediate chain-domain-containing protein [Pisolithus orientalis]